MNGGLKALIAVACVAIIAFVGQQFYFQYEGRSAAKARADAVISAQTCRDAREALAYYQAGGKPGESKAHYMSRAEAEVQSEMCAGR